LARRQVASLRLEARRRPPAVPDAAGRQEGAPPHRREEGARCHVAELAAEATATGKAAAPGRAYRAESSPELRRIVFERLPTPPDAAIALYRLTGEKVKQFPAGYEAD